MKAIGLGHRIRELAGSHLITMESGSLTVIGKEIAAGLNMTTAGTKTEAAILIGTETAAKQHHCRNHSSTSGPSLETTRGRDQRPRACRVVDFRVLRYFPYCTNTSLLFFSTLETSEMLLAIAALLIQLPTVAELDSGNHCCRIRPRFKRSRPCRARAGHQSSGCSANFVAASFVCAKGILGASLPSTPRSPVPSSLADVSGFH